MFAPRLPETSLATLADEILANAAALRAVHPTAQPLAFWDFDGTLFEGDCAEGFQPEGQPYVRGLVECAVMACWSRSYEAEGGFARCWADYQSTMAREGVAAAYAHLVRTFAGAPEAALRALAAQEFDRRLQDWFFREALQLWGKLEAGGVHCVVISGSPDFFVKGAAGVLGIPTERLHGVRCAVGADGLVTDLPVAPITVGPGKVALLQQLLESMGVGSGPRYPVAAFGNDLFTDGPMLEAVAGFPLPGGTPIATLVNGRVRAPVAGRLREITFSRRFAP